MNTFFRIMVAEHLRNKECRWPLLFWPAQHSSPFYGNSNSVCFWGAILVSPLQLQTESAIQIWSVSVLCSQFAVTLFLEYWYTIQLCPVRVRSRTSVSSMGKEVVFALGLLIHSDISLVLLAAIFTAGGRESAPLREGVGLQPGCPWVGDMSHVT